MDILSLVLPSGFQTNFQLRIWYLIEILNSKYLKTNF